MDDSDALRLQIYHQMFKQLLTVALKATNYSLEDSRHLLTDSLGTDSPFAQYVAFKLLEKTQSGRRA